MSITDTSSLLRARLPPMLDPNLGCGFPLPIWPGSIDFTCSLKWPVLCFRQLNPGWDVATTCGRPLHFYHSYKRNYLFFPPNFAFTRLHHWFSRWRPPFRSAPQNTPTGIFAPVFPYPLTTHGFPQCAA